jgi:uncharacterized protein
MLAAGRPALMVGPAVEAVGALLQARIDKRADAAIVPLRAAVVERFLAAGFTQAEADGGLAMIDTPQAWQVDKLRAGSDLKALRISVLAIFGSKDPLVVASDEAPAATAVLAGNPRARVVVLQGLSHWFQEGAVTGNAEEVERLGPNMGSPRVVTLVGDFVRDAVSPVRAASR